MISLLLGAAAVSVVHGRRIDVDWNTWDEALNRFEAAPGDVLVFAWRGFHNVYLLPSCDGNGAQAWDDFTCPRTTAEWGTNLGDNGLVEYTVPDDASGFLCFACEVGSHCMFGQHSTVTITGGDGGATGGDGGATGKNIDVDWRIVSSDETMQSLVGSPGDTVTFAWRGNHNVYLLDNCDGEGAQAWDSFTCPSSNWGTEIGNGRSPVVYTIPEDAAVGSYLCFVCEVGQHCMFGQHSTLRVEASSGGADPVDPVGPVQFESRDELLAACRMSEDPICKACVGKFKRGKCKIKTKKFKKVRCQKFKTQLDFCARIPGCVEKKGKCSGRIDLD